MQKLSEPKAKALPKPQDEPEEPQDPTPLLESWVRKQLPLVEQDKRDAIVSAYVTVRREWPPSAELFELCCELWVMGQRSAKPAVASSRTGRPRPKP